MKRSKSKSCAQGLRLRYWAFVSVVLSMAGAAALGKDVWVDAANYGKSGLTGETLALAYGTIQDGVDAAQDGDTVWVAPGVYDKGGFDQPSRMRRSRVHIEGKRLKLAATSANRDDTHIVGNWDSSPNVAVGFGIGETESRRCITLFKADGTIVQGFTLRDGASCYADPDSDVQQSAAGGVLALDATGAWSPSAGTIVDCVIRNCSGIRGGAMRGGTAVRCVFVENVAFHTGDAGRAVNFVNCLLVRNGTDDGTHRVAYESLLVNCTVSNNGGTLSNCRLYNTVAMNNTYYGELGSVQCAVYNYVTRFDGGDPKYKGDSDFDSCHTNASLYQFVAPAYDDYRIRHGAEAETTGDAQWLKPGEVVTLPDGIDPLIDLDGQTIPSSGAICAGAFQTAVQTRSGVVLFVPRYAFRFDGRLNFGKEVYAFASDAFPTQFVFQATDKGAPRIFSFKVDGETLFPTSDDVAAIMPPDDPSSIRKITVVQPSVTRYVDCATGEDAPRTDAAETDPYETIQAAIDSLKSGGALIEVAAGDYRKGGMLGYGDISNRVASSLPVRIVGQGADKSVIWGEAPDVPGKAGMRCVTLHSRSAIQGFTLRDGFAATNGDDGSDDEALRGGGFYGNATTSGKSASITDCVITNCAAYRGGAAFAGTLERCRIVDCTAGKGVCRYVRIFSCVISGLTPPDGYDGRDNSYGASWNCTFLGRSPSEYVIGTGSSDVVSNCVVLTSRDLARSMANVGCTIAWDMASCEASGVELANPLLANVALTGNCRPMGISPTLGYGEPWDFVSVNPLDMECRPFRFSADGRITAGAYQWPVATISVVPPRRGKLLPLGYVGPEPDGTVVLEYEGSTLRRLLGYSVNGRFVPASGIGRVAISLTEADLESDTSISPVFEVKGTRVLIR